MLVAKLKRKIRGGAVVEHFTEDPEAKHAERFLVFSRGVQAFLNILFASERAVSTYTDLLTTVPAKPAMPTDGVKKARAEANRRNIDIISGKDQKKILKNYTELFNSYEGNVWSDFLLGIDGKFATLLDLVPVACDFRHRAIFKMTLRSMIRSQQVRTGFLGASRLERPEPDGTSVSPSRQAIQSLA